MRRILAITVALTLASCAGDSKPPPAPAPPPPSAPDAPAPVSLPPAPISVPPPPKPDQCGAYAMGDLVGKPRTAIPVPLDPFHRRVIYTTCPKTADVRPDRLTIEYDAKTGKVTKVGCN